MIDRANNRGPTPRVPEAVKDVIVIEARIELRWLNGEADDASPINILGAENRCTVTPEQLKLSPHPLLIALSAETVKNLVLGFEQGHAQKIGPLCAAVMDQIRAGLLQVVDTGKRGKILDISGKPATPAEN